MDARSRSPGPRMSMAAVERAGAQGELGQGRRRGGGWPWLIVGAALAAIKALGPAELLHHRTRVIVLVGLGLAVSVFRIRPVGIALTGAVLFALVLGPRPLVLAGAVGLGAFTVLLALFTAIATVPHARQDHDRTGISRVID